MYIAIGQKKRARKLGRKAAAKRGAVVAAGVEGKPGKTQITINEGDRQKGRGKKRVWGENVVTSNSGRPMRVDSAELSDNPTH